MDNTIKDPAEHFAFSAQWISPPKFQAKSNIYFRAVRAFRVPEQHLRRKDLYLRICADSYYCLWLNGQCLQHGPVRGSANSNFYDTLDVSEYLRKGLNHIAVLVHSPVVHTFVSVSVVPALILEIPGVVKTDSSWRVQEAADWKEKVPFYTQQTDFLEERDYRLEPVDWILGKHTENWESAKALPKMHPLAVKRLLPRDIPALREKELLPVLATPPQLVLPLPRKPEKISLQLNEEPYGNTEKILIRPFASLTKGEETVICPPGRGKGVVFLSDFGRSCLGRLKLSLTAPANTILDVVYSEEPWKEHPERLQACYDVNDNYNFCDRYVLDGKSRTVTTEVSLRGFRWIQLVFRNFTRPVLIHRFSVVVQEYPFVQNGAFRCSDDFCSRLWVQCSNTLQTCATDTFMDCPWRERAFWVNDLLVENSSALALYGDSPMLRRCFRLLFDQQLENGLVPGVCPAPPAAPCVLLPTNFFLFLMAEEFYFATGDREWLKELIAPLEKTLQGMEQFLESDGLLHPADRMLNFYDWSYEENGYDFNGQCESMLNILYWMALKRLRRFREICSMKESPLVSDSKLLRLAKKIRSTFWDPGKKQLLDPVRYTPGAPITLRSQPNARRIRLASQLSHAIAFVSGIFPDLQDAILKNLKDERLLKPEYYLHYFTFRAAETASPADDLAACELEQIKKFWRINITEGLSGISEFGVYDFGRHAVNGIGSLCHGFATSPVRFFHRVVLGVRPLLPGYQRFLIDPQPAGLDFAEGKVPTPYGNISVFWRKKTKSQYEIKLLVPPGTVAIMDGMEYIAGSHQVNIRLQSTSPVKSPDSSNKEKCL